MRPHVAPLGCHLHHAAELLVALAEMVYVIGPIGIVVAVQPKIDV